MRSTHPTPLQVSRRVPPDTGTGSRDPQLGIPIGAYKGRGFSWKDLFTLGLPGILAVSAPVTYGLWLYQNAYTQFGPAAAQSWSRPWFLLATVGLIAFLILFIYRLIISRRYIRIYKDGLKLHLNSFQTRTLHWQEITGIRVDFSQARFLGVAARPRYASDLLLPKRRLVHLQEGHVQSLPELITQLKDSIYPRLLPVLEGLFQTGEQVDFGPISVQRSAVRVHNQSRPWADLKRVSIQSGLLLVEWGDRTTRRIPISQISNLELLLQFIEQGANP